MGTKNRPAPHDCYSLAEGDEPLFVLLARDAHAPFLVRAWADMREASGETPDKVEEARSCADAMARWRLRRRERESMGTADAVALLGRGAVVGPLLRVAGAAGAGSTRENLAREASGLDEAFEDLPDWAGGGDESGDGDGEAGAVLTPTQEASAETAAPLADKPASGAPVIDVEGVPAPEPEKKGVPVANVMKLPDPETLARISSEPGASSKPLAKSPPARPAPAKPALPPGASEKEVEFRGWITIGAPGEVLLRRVCEHVFSPLTMATNAPGLGFARLVDFRVGNQRLLYGPSEHDPSVQDFYQADLYEYCVKGAGSRDVRAPRVAPNSAITIVVVYSGQVPDGYAWGAPVELTVTLRGLAVDRRML